MKTVFQNMCSEIEIEGNMRILKHLGVYKTTMGAGSNCSSRPTNTAALLNTIFKCQEFDIQKS